MNIISITGIVIIACILCITIKPYQPAFAISISILTGIYIVVNALEPVYNLINSLKSIISSASINSNIYGPVIKILGISIVINIGSAVCKDCGEHALSTKLELIGSICALILCFPLIDNLIILISNILGISL